MFSAYYPPHSDVVGAGHCSGDLTVTMSVEREHVATATHWAGAGGGIVQGSLGLLLLLASRHGPALTLQQQHTDRAVSKYKKSRIDSLDNT